MKERALDDLARQRDLLQGEHSEQLSVKKAEFDAVKRGFDELHYESENLRRTINQKQEEISSLQHMINQQAHNADQLAEKIRQLEETVQDVEEKNKRLVDLLNANIYNKAEQYKEKVMTRLLERTPVSQTPAINVPPVLQQLTIQNRQFSQFKQGMPTDGAMEPSPIRLQRIMFDEQEQKQKERDRYLKLAEKITTRALNGAAAMTD